MMDSMTVTVAAKGTVVCMLLIIVIVLLVI